MHIDQNKAAGKKKMKYDATAKRRAAEKGTVGLERISTDAFLKERFENNTDQRDLDAWCMIIREGHFSAKVWILESTTNICCKFPIYYIYGNENKNCLGSTSRSRSFSINFF